MGRRLRYIPPEGSLVDVGTRTTQGRYLLRPSPALKEIILGVMGRAQRLSGTTVIDFRFLSNHYHLLLWVESAHQLARFMSYLNGNLAREVARLHSWRGRVWSGRYHCALVSEEEVAQVERLRYLFANSCKEGLVASPRDWPGASSLPAILEGEELTGRWFNRTREWAARQRRETFEPDDYAEEETVHLSPLPCWAHLSPEAYRHRIHELVTEIEEETRRQHQEAGTTPAGPAAVQRVDPRTAPKRPKKSFPPLAHCATKKIRQEIWNAYSIFVNAFHEAAEQLRSGNLSAVFPEGAFPPPAPFVQTLLEPG